MRRKRGIRIQRKARKIGFLGKGAAMPSYERSEIVDSLRLRIGDELVSTDESDRTRCRYDFETLPGLLTRIFSTRPSAVVFPDTARCVAEVLDVCIEERTHAIIRGAATSGLGGVFAVRRSVVIDLARLRGIDEVDVKARQVTVKAGSTWEEVSKALETEGLALLCFPSSGSRSTVGGWMSTGGYGSGSLRYGNFHQIVRSLEVALPSGLLVSAGGEGLRYSIRSFAGTEGQMGAITRLTFPVRDIPEEVRAYLVSLGRLDEATEILTELVLCDPRPVGLRLLSGNLASQLGIEIDENWRNRFMVVVEMDGTRKQVSDFENRLSGIIRRLGIEKQLIRPSGTTESYPLMRYLDAKGGVLGGEVIVESDGLGLFLQRAVGRAGKLGEPVFECDMVSPERIVVRIAYRPDHGTRRFVRRDVRLTLELATVAMRMGGKPYGIGLWNAPFARRIVGADYDQLKSVKNETDRPGIVNPGRLFYLKTSSGLTMPGWMLKLLVKMLKR